MKLSLGVWFTVTFSLLVVNGSMLWLNLVENVYKTMAFFMAVTFLTLCFLAVVFWARVLGGDKK